MKSIKFLLTTVLLVKLTACASTNSYWKEPLPENPNALSTMEKERLYNHLSVDEISVFEFYEDSIKTKENSEKYSIKTFYPMILQISPKLKSELDSIEFSQHVRTWTISTLFSLSLTPILFSSLSTDLDRDNRVTNYGVSLLAMFAVIGIDFGFLFWQQNKYNEIIEVYNKDLNRYIFDSKFSSKPQINAQVVNKKRNLPTQINFEWNF
jgi:hypothetical protein